MTTLQFDFKKRTTNTLSVLDDVVNIAGEGMRFDGDSCNVCFEKCDDLHLNRCFIGTFLYHFHFLNIRRKFGVDFHQFVQFISASLELSKFVGARNQIQSFTKIESINHGSIFTT